MVDAIYQFKNSDHEWADYKLPEGATLIRKIDISTYAALNKAYQTETGRIKALAERALTQHKHEVDELNIIKRGFFGRLKYVFRGK